jgi:hypothetical protein
VPEDHGWRNVITLKVEIFQSVWYGGSIVVSLWDELDNLSLFACAGSSLNPRPATRPITIQKAPPMIQFLLRLALLYSRPSILSTLHHFSCDVIVCMKVWTKNGEGSTVEKKKPSAGPRSLVNRDAEGLSCTTVYSSSAVFTVWYCSMLDFRAWSSLMATSIYSSVRGALRRVPPATR